MKGKGKGKYADEAAAIRAVERIKKQYGAWPALRLHGAGDGRRRPCPCGCEPEDTSADVRYNEDTSQARHDVAGREG